ncbi:MAG: restriction endonuclease subunit S [Candidatus Kapabacteria bacterium]|jgi:type I restriction enzyme S subunit|nr:restriction endonuclease subunit S [Candidatus Kapabacteria bacterium]
MNSTQNNNWQTKKLGEVCKTTSGGTPSRRSPNYYNGTIPWVKSGELDKGVIYDTEEKITEEAIKNSSAKIFPKGTLLIALYGATIGKLAFLGVDSATNQAVCGIFENENIVSKYLYYFLLFNKPKLVQQGIGGAQPNISQTILKNLDLPIPDLTTQHLIVSKIETLFSELDQGIAELKKAQEQLKTYRQSVLKYAFEGRFTNPNIKEGELPKGWEWKTLKEITNKVAKVKRKEMSSKDEFIYLDIGGINNENNKIDSYKTYKWIEAPSRAQQIVKFGDILFSTVRTYMKNIAVVDKEKFNNQIASSGFTVLRANDNMDYKYVFYNLISDIFLNPLNELQTGSSYPAVRDSDVLSQKINVPPLSEQHLIVQEIESRLSVADKMAETISESLQKAEALRQSILKKAFSGKLV